MSVVPRNGLLLDTHAFIWWATSDERLSGQARAAVADPDTTVLLSVIVPWEMAIKHALGRLELTDAPRAVVYGQIARHGFQPFDVALEHVFAAGELPLHHRDPFDRLLIAQARTEGLTLVSGDGIFDRYDVAVLW